MKLVFLGRFRELVRSDIGQRPGHVRTVADLKSWLAGIEPALGRALENEQARIVVNQHVVHDPLHLLADADEIAFLPPMSGG